MTAWNSPPPPPGNPYRHWLTHSGSLTQRIVERCPNFWVVRAHQGPQQPAPNEAGLIGIRSKQMVLVRDVYLYCGDTPLVFAHSVVQLRDLKGAWHSLDKLGTKPLAAALFSDPRVKRFPLAFAAIDRRHPLYQRACAALGAAPRRLWARRSLFKLHGRPILVTEVFLPTILELQC